MADESRAIAVAPWTWARLVRDEAPSGVNSRNVVCAMWALRTWADERGIAFPGLRAWSKAARMSINTLRKQIKIATETQWLFAEASAGQGKRWAVPRYRLCVPARLELTETDEKLRASILKLIGDIPFAVSPMVDTPNAAVSPKGDTPNSRRRVGVSTESSETALVCQKNGLVYQPEHVGVSPRLTQKFLEAHEVSSEKRLNGGPEVLNKYGKTKPKDPKPLRLEKAKKLISASPDLADKQLCRMYDISGKDVQRLRRQVNQEMNP